MPAALELAQHLYAGDELRVTRHKRSGKLYLCSLCTPGEDILAKVKLSEAEAKLFNGLLAIGGGTTYDTLESLISKFVIAAREKKNGT